MKLLPQQNDLMKDTKKRIYSLIQCHLIYYDKIFDKLRVSQFLGKYLEAKLDLEAHSSMLERLNPFKNELEVIDKQSLKTRGTMAKSKNVKSIQEMIE